MLKNLSYHLNLDIDIQLKEFDKVVDYRECND